jgi:hypothetical protein
MSSLHVHWICTHLLLVDQAEDVLVILFDLFFQVLYHFLFRLQITLQLLHTPEMWDPAEMSSFITTTTTITKTTIIEIIIIITRLQLVN